MTFPDEYVLPSSYPICNGFLEKDNPEAVAFVEAYNAIRQRISDGSMYIKFIAGDRKGSIARIRFNLETYVANAFEDAKIEYSYRVWVGGRDQSGYRIDRDHFYCIAYWDKRKNKVKISLPNKEVVFLPNYTGPTIYQMFDHKAAKQAALEAPEQLDIDGRLLAVGDKVLYINARYGSAFVLSHGVVKEFQAVVDSKKKEIWTIVENAEGVESKIANSKEMIWKKD